MISRAVVLAAGRGTRMGDLTAELPKPMLPVRGRPMLEHVLEALALAGIERFLVVVGYRRELVEQHFRGWRLPIEYSVQSPVDGTGSAARLARAFAGNEPVLLTFGDILCEVGAYTRCAATLKNHPSAVAAIGARDMDDPWRAAAIYEEQGRITRIVEKPPRGSSSTRWASGGLYAFRPLAFDWLDRIRKSPRGEYEVTTAFEDMLAAGLELRLSPMEGKWRDVGRPEDLENANLPPGCADDPNQN